MPYWLPVSRAMALMLNSMTSRPMVTVISSTKPSQPSTMALVPTPECTLPLPKSSVTEAADTEAVCCQRTLMRMKTLATKMRASVIWHTGREGKGLMSISEPVSGSSSSCQPGKVARRMMQTKVRRMATMLSSLVVVGHRLGELT